MRDDTAGAGANPVRRVCADHALLLIALGGLVALLVWRVTTHGVLPIAPDDAEYIGVGRRLLSLERPTHLNGNLYTIRSWVWPLLTGSASRLIPGDVFRGPKMLGVGLGLGAILGATFYAYRRRGGVAAIATATILGLTAVVWEVAGSTRVDVALMAFIVFTMLVAAEPSPRRALLAGFLAGVTLLVKESSALLVLLPLAWLRRDQLRSWWRQAYRFWLAFALTVSWWFVFILVNRGEIFPFQGLNQAIARDLPRAWAPNAAAVALVLAWVVAWLVLIWRGRSEVGIRVLGVGMLAMLPAAVIAWQNELALRQFAPIAILGAVSVGVAVGEAFDWVLGPRPRRPGARFAVTVAVGMALVAAAVVPILHLQQDSVVVVAPALDRDSADWLRSHTRPNETIASSFRFETLTWARIGDRNDFELLGLKNSSEAPEIGRQVWIDWSDGAFRSLARREFAIQVGRAKVVLLTGRHRLGPIALARWLDERGEAAGLKPVAQFGALGTPGWVHVYRVRPIRHPAIPTLVTTTASAHLSVDQIRRLGPFVLAGTEASIRREQRHLALLTTSPTDTIVTPAR